MADTPNTPKQDTPQESKVTLVFNRQTPKVTSKVGKLAYATLAREGRKVLYVALRNLSESDAQAFRTYVATEDDGATVITSDAHSATVEGDLDKLRTHVHNARKGAKVAAQVVNITEGLDKRPFGVRVEILPSK